MRARTLLLLALGVLLASGLAWWLVERQAQGDAVSETIALPGFAGRVDAVDRIEVLGAGANPLVSIEKRDGQWLMPDRDGWPANQREVGSALFRLGQVRRIEAKTADPGRHARLGVEDVSAADAKGTQLVLSGGAGEPVRVTVGNNHPTLGGSYVRLGDQAQAWLLDEDIAPARSAPDWLDRRLLDLPMARIDLIRVTPAKGRAFVLSRVDDRFSLDGLSPNAMADPDAGNTTAQFTQQLPLDDVAKDTGAAATQTAVFETLDGLRITVAAWPQDAGTWARLAVELDEDRAAAWFAKPPAAPGVEPDGAAADSAGVDAAKAAPSERRLADLRTQVDAWRQSFAGRQFLLPAEQAQALMRSRNDYLDGTR
ncbi:MAG: DUF4340 domain-containing protein [Arenimonas sp.]|uniref:DUF4340 domain-containing protein n=1 Tax=Arenimonas sp. TaxID=1872635 RepID=UPI0025C22BF8|nr:DUF4340 domain-containing protein [Arenimonas sp.]MBW8366609.1 DUF4340 domain-containing protein [Arenimonas sp.]